ncbi:MAG: HEPN domain-containing protein [Schwartzia sp.]|nr:HEPN domain-containing protein [Schwartzia sp. (in: firmicutes)]
MDKAIDPKEWLCQAKNELEVAKHLREVFRPMPMEIICFHAQQAAEKAVKAVVLYQATDSRIEKKHDISVLLDRIDKDRAPFDAVFYEYADELFPYSVITRYPSQLQDNIDEPRVHRALSRAETIWHWANGTIMEAADSTDKEQQ